MLKPTPPFFSKVNTVFIDAKFVFLKVESVAAAVLKGKMVVMEGTHY